MSAAAPPSQRQRQWGLGVLWIILALTFGWLLSAATGWLAVATYAAIKHKSFSVTLFLLDDYTKPALRYVFEHVILHHDKISKSAFFFYKFLTSFAGSVFTYTMYTIEILLVLCALVMTFKKSGTGYIHVGGLYRIDDAKEALARCRKLLKKNRGVRIHPDERCRLSLQAETRHFLYVGMSGAGKSQAMQYPMLDAIERGDRVVIHDVKGEYSTLFSIADYRSGKVVMLHPEDARGSCHALAADCADRDTAAELISSTLIPSMAAEDFWIKAARGVLSGILIGLNRLYPRGRWGWKEFAKVFEPATEGPLQNQPVLIQQLVAAYSPNDLVNLGGIEQQAGVISNIRADTRNIDHLAKAWPHPGGFSIRRWIRGEAHKKTQILILRGIPDQEYYKAALATQFSLALTTAMSLPDRDNRLWFFIDEVAQLNKIMALKKAMLFLRSKGARVVLGIQDAASLNEIYGEDAVNSIMGMCGNKIFGQASGGMARWSAEWFSSIERERLNATAQANQSADTLDLATGSGLQYSTSFQREEVDAVPAWAFETLPDSVQPSAFAAALGVKGGPTMYVKCVGFENFVLRLFYPYSAVEERSPQHMPRKRPPGRPRRDPATAAQAIKVALKKIDASEEKTKKRTARKPQNEVERNVVTEDEQLTTVKVAQQTNTEVENKDATPTGEIMSEISEEGAETMIPDPTGLGIVGALIDAAEAASVTDGEASTQQQNPGVHHAGEKKKKRKPRLNKQAVKALTGGR